MGAISYYLINNTYRLMYLQKYNCCGRVPLLYVAESAPNSNTGCISLTTGCEAQTQIKYCNPKKLVDKSGAPIENVRCQIRIIGSMD